MNNTKVNASECLRDTSVTAVVFPCLYSFLFLSALILNSLAAWIFFSIPSTSTFVVFLKNVVRRHLLTLNINSFMQCVGKKKSCKTRSFQNKTGGGWLADDLGHPYENPLRCRFGILEAECLPLPLLGRALLHHHVHQHHPAGPDQPGPLPKDRQALREDRSAAGPRWSGDERSRLGGDAIAGTAQRHPDWPAAEILWREAEVHLNEEPAWLTVAWRIQLLLPGTGGAFECIYK